MKLLHTSDILLGECFAHCHPVASELRKARLEGLRSLLALARKEKVEGIIVAGNLWADNRVGHTLVKQAAELLSKSTVPVYLLPGHRDPLTPDSPYELFSDYFQGQVHILRNEEPFHASDSLVLLPCPVRIRQSTADLGWIPPREGDQFRVSVVNTADERLALPSSIDYVAAGGRLESSIEKEIHYCGTPEPTDFGQQEGVVLVIELNRNNGVTTRPVKLASLHWVEEYETVRSEQEVAALERRWSATEQRAATLLRLSLRGRLDAPGLAALQMTIRSLSAKLLFLDLRNEVVPDEETLSFSHPLLRSTALALTDQATGPEADPDDLPGDAEIARLALSQLIEMLQTGTHQDLV
ncbi:MAG: hypothetical protein WC314_25355 [Vulcanimicrobiota bacterium]